MRAARVVLLSTVAAASLSVASEAPARGAEPVALAPLETLGNQSKVARNLQARIARALAGVAGFEVVDGRKVRRALSRKPTLRACDGKARCLAELGRTVAARYVVYGEVGGLGQVQIVYLKVIDVNGRKELRSTTVDLGADDRDRQARAAAVRLLAPERYRGTLALAVDVEGASIYVDGKRIARSPSDPIALPVGTHALRVTHPEFRDFVRFVDVAFDECVFACEVHELGVL